MPADMQPAGKTTWKAKRFRVFVSYNSKHDAAVGRLKEEIERYGLSVFVAGYDLEAMKQWADQLRWHLDELDVLVAYVTEDFSSNAYTDNEVGWVLGRRKPIVPILVAADANAMRGLLRPIHAITNCVADDPHQMAKEVLIRLANDDRTRIEVRRTLMLGLQDCRDRVHADQVLSVFGDSPELNGPVPILWTGGLVSALWACADFVDRWFSFRPLLQTALGFGRRARCGFADDCRRLRCR
jgi:hypothetical protein